MHYGMETMQRAASSARRRQKEKRARLEAVIAEFVYLLFRVSTRR